MHAFLNPSPQCHHCSIHTKGPQLWVPLPIKVNEELRDQRIHLGGDVDLPTQGPYHGAELLSEYGFFGVTSVTSTVPLGVTTSGPS